MSDADLADLARDLRRAPVLVVTGAGVSHASGVPTFRGSDAGAIWAKSVKQMGTRAFFEHDPAASLRWYLERFGLLRGKEPNAGHRALAQLERRCDDEGRAFLLATQNVDSLHELAGSKAIVKVHGTADRVRCERTGCENGAPSGSIARTESLFEAFLADPVEANLPRCPACGGRLRPHVLWFDETYPEHADYQFERVQRAAARAAMALFVGTSFAVGITDLILSACAGRAPVWSIDPSTRAPPDGVRHIVLKSEDALPQVLALLDVP